MRRRPSYAAALALLAGALAACGGGSADPGGDAVTSEPTSTVSPASTDPGATDPTSDDTEDTVDPAAYLPVPDDVELTEPGTSLRLRDAASVAWTPRQDLVGVVGIEVVRIEQTTVEESLAAFRLDDAAAASTPYFVTSLVGNDGETDLGGRQLPLYVVDTEGRLVPPTGVDQGFEACPGGLLPAIFAPGDRTRSCSIFLVPQGAELASVMFRPPEGVVPITWTGKVKQLGDRGRPPVTRNSGGKGG